MLFKETYFPGVFVITLDLMTDERGFFARSFCQKEFQNRQLHSDFVQCNISFNRKKGTLRGLHYQKAPYGEVKIVSCRRGTIYDVVVDVRKHSETYGKWISVELSEHNHQALYIPEGFAHGFQTLEDNTEVFYHMGNYYFPEAATGIRWNDPHLQIPWPLKKMILSKQDSNLPELTL